MKLVEKFKSLTDNDMTRIIERSQSVLWTIMVILVAIWLIARLILSLIGYYSD